MLTVLFTVFSLIPATTPSASAAESTLLKPGTLAPTFMLPTLDNNRVALRVWCGDTLSSPYVNRIKHTVVISFWATYCKPCMYEMPQLMAFAKKHKGEPVKVFGVSIDKEGPAVVAPFVREKGWDLPCLLDPYSKTSERYGVKSIPALFVINPSGVIQFSAQGFEDGTDLVEKLDAVLADIAAGKGPSGRVLVGGESVAVQPPAGTAAPVADLITPQQKWRSVARIECGAKPDDVAREMGVSVETVRSWYDELKKSAMGVWAKNP